MLSVALSYFEARAENAGTQFEWATANEVGNVGFNLYAEEQGELKLLNGEPLPSRALNSLESQEYTFAIAGVAGETFFLEDLDILGQRTLHGPYQLGVPFGQRLTREAIDWSSIQAEHEAKAVERQTKAGTKVVAVKEGVQVSLSGAPPSKEAASRRLAKKPPRPTDTPTPEPTDDPELPPTEEPVSAWDSPVLPVDLLVRSDGIYRVTYEYLLDAGFDLVGAPSDQLALSSQGVSVPIYVSAGSSFGPGAYFEFYGQALDTLYTDTNVYILTVDSGAASRMSLANFSGSRLGVKPVKPTPTPVPTSVPSPAAFYMDTVKVENERAYSFSSPNGDPWYDTRMLVYTSAKVWTFAVNVDHYAGDIAPVFLNVEMWGGTDWQQSPDHHVAVGFNGVPVADRIFDGLSAQVVSIMLPRGLLREGTNSLELTLPGDTGVDFDLVNLDRFSLTYPRGFVAREGRLSFEGSGDLYQVEGLPTSNVLVYRVSSGIPSRIADVQVDPSGDGYVATFAGSAISATYYVSSVEALPGPEVKSSHLIGDDITEVPAQYLVISHPDFIAGLDPLLQARKAEGLIVRLVNVQDVYAQFSHGVFDPQAIRDYIAYAAANLGTEYVLLVGGDTYDYRGYLGQGVVNFLPTLYAPMDDGIVNFAPADGLYADVNGDNVPDVAIGRFPARTSAELDAMVAKTLAYGQKSYGGTAVFAADKTDGINSFTDKSESLVGLLPASWAVARAYVDDLGLSSAKVALLGSVNQGVALTNYYGHSSTTAWTYEALFNTSDAEALGNNGSPTVVTQWACWNTYFVDPTYNTLGVQFMLYGDRGAAAVAGAATLTQVASVDGLSALAMPKLTQPGMTIGRAIRDAKQELAAARPYGASDVLLAWTLLGDPALMITP